MMFCRITDGPQPDCEFLDDLTEVEEQLILTDLDPDWTSKFRSAGIAWNFYLDFNAAEMEQAASELIRERQSPLLMALRDIAGTRI